ncbi:MAG: hypothetical protein M0Q29_09915 [Thiopseudomonas sp.]|nr:hypothetical protein [Thiopseudomonas sp.]
MTGLKWKPQVNRDGDKVANCWLTECRYKVARCFIGSAERYMVTAPGARAAFAYVGSREEVVAVIKIDKELHIDRS